MCTYRQRTPRSTRFEDYLLVRRVAIPQRLVPPLLTALGRAEPFDPRVAYCGLGTPKALALSPRNGTGGITPITLGGPGCGALVAEGGTWYVGGDVLDVLEAAGY